MLKSLDKKSKLEEQYKYTEPSEREMTFLYRVHQQCFYYRVGLQKCRERIYEEYEKAETKPAELDFSRCKETLDSYYSCSTHDLFGKKIEDMLPKLQPYMVDYTKCVFYENADMDLCQKHFDDILRYYYRQTDSKLKQVL